MTGRGGLSGWAANGLGSIEAALREEIAACQEQCQPATWLDIDGIEPLPGRAGRHAYRLALSAPANLSSDQPITFRVRRPPVTVNAVVVAADECGLVVECEDELPPEARLLQLTLDPTFILRALERFLCELAPTGNPIARLVLDRTLCAPPHVAPRTYPGLNDDQCRAVEEMAATPVRLLWGPPGTGKTTTLGAAVVRWMREGLRVLVVSTSNAAVDVALRAVLSDLTPGECGQVRRLGSSVDPQLQRYIRNDAPAAAGVRVVGCTLAKMVLDRGLRVDRFDVVVVDEASMASLVYAFAASMLAQRHLVYAGDPQQLPPIVQANGGNAADWFGQNIFDWFRVGTEQAATASVSMLRTQYRMTEEIGGLVSRLSYNGLLRHGRGVPGPRVEFVDVGPEWEESYYGVADRSYYHPATVPIVHRLAALFPQGELLLLSPFRPQRSLLAAVAFDLQQQAPGRVVTASTVHRAQGSEAKTVVVDLTTHSPTSLARFFRDEHCDRLLNVGLSRARDRLVVIGSRAMLAELAKTSAFWDRVVSEFGRGLDHVAAGELLGRFRRPELPVESAMDRPLGHPALYCHAARLGSDTPGVEALRLIPATRKLFVTPNSENPHVATDSFIVRTSTDCPPVFAAGGWLCLPWNGQWVVVNSPNASRTLWRVGFNHLADEEIDPNQAHRFDCPECATGQLIVRRFQGEGWFLVCNNGQVWQCSHRQRLSLRDAELKVRLHNMRCPNSHPLTARNRGSGQYFLGCENYPQCDHTETFSILAGM
jgi:hypothetical protein